MQNMYLCSTIDTPYNGRLLFRRPGFNPRVPTIFSSFTVFPLKTLSPKYWILISFIWILSNITVTAPFLNLKICPLKSLDRLTGIWEDIKKWQKCPDSLFKVHWNGIPFVARNERLVKFYSFISLYIIIYAQKFESSFPKIHFSTFFSTL